MTNTQDNSEREQLANYLQSLKPVNDKAHHLAIADFILADRAAQKEALLAELEAEGPKNEPREYYNALQYNKLREQAKQQVAPQTTVMENK